MRKDVTSSEFDVAYKNKDNRKVIDSVTGRYRKIIDKDDLQSAGMMALWRCLSYHDDSYNQKFTTSLWRFTDWECKRILRSKRNKPQSIQLTFDIDNVIEAEEVSEDNVLVQECMNLLYPSEKAILELYFYENRTMDEIGKMCGFSKETARQKINKSMDKLKEILKKEMMK